MIHACFACYWPSLGHEQAFTASFYIFPRPLQQFFQVLDRRHEVTLHLHLPPATPAGAFMSVYVFRFGEAALRDVHPTTELCHEMRGVAVRQRPLHILFFLMTTDRSRS